MLEDADLNPIPDALVFSFDDLAFEGTHFGFINHIVQANELQFQDDIVDAFNGGFFAFFILGGGGWSFFSNPTTITITDPNTDPDIDPFTDVLEMEDLIGRRIEIVSGLGLGENRFIVAVADDLDDMSMPTLDWELTLDRPWTIDDAPDEFSRYQIRIDDATVGTAAGVINLADDLGLGLDISLQTLIDEGLLPSNTAELIEPTLFVVADSLFTDPDFISGQGLTGRVIEIVGGRGAGQQRLILGHYEDTQIGGVLDINDQLIELLKSNTLILNGDWRIAPDPTSIFRIENYDGLVIPSIQVQINDNDTPNVIVDETSGYESGIVDDFDTITSLIEGGDGDHRGEHDILRVQLSRAPAMGEMVTVDLIYDSDQLDIQNIDALGPQALSLMFDDTNTSIDLLVSAVDDDLREGFHNSLIQFEIVAGPGPVENLGTSETFNVAQDIPAFFVGLSERPTSVTSVMVDKGDGEGPKDLVADLNLGFIVIGNKVIFNDGAAENPGLVSLFGAITVLYDTIEPGFIGAFGPPILARIADNDAPTVLIRETDGSTDVIETRIGVFFDPTLFPDTLPLLGVIAASINPGLESPWVDSYEVVLTAAPTSDVVVVLSPDITKTTRTGGIRHDADQVVIFDIDGDTRLELVEFTATGGDSDTLTDSGAQFITDGIKVGDRIENLDESVAVRVTAIISETELETESVGDWNGADYSFGNWTVTFLLADTDWDDPVVVGVRAIDDRVVDGMDTKEFAPGPDFVAGILGPLFVNGAGGSGSLSLNNPLMLPGETNAKPSVGDLATPFDGETQTPFVDVFTDDLNAGLGLVDADTIADLVNKTIEVTSVENEKNLLHSAIGQFRLITEVALDFGTAEDPNDPVDPMDPDGPGVVKAFTRLFINAIFDINLGEKVGEEFTDIQGYTLTQQSLNFFVNEQLSVDVMFVHDDDSPADSSATLTSTRLFGLNMGPDIAIGGVLRTGGVTYEDLEVIDIDLGVGNNTLDILGTYKRPDGYQTWTIIHTGDETIEYMGQKGDTVNVSISEEETILIGGVGEGLEFETANQANAGNFYSLVDNDLIDGLAPFGADGSLAGKAVQILAMDGSVKQTRQIITNTAHEIFLDGPFVPDFTVEPADPADFPLGFEYQIIDPADGNLSVNLGQGDDFLDATGSTKRVVAFGGEGDDTLIGGEADDILFGDKGRVDYFGEAIIFGEEGSEQTVLPIVTRLGFAPEPITGFVTEQVAESPVGSQTDLSTIEDSNASFPVPDTDIDGIGTDDIGLIGLEVDINNGQGFLQPVRFIFDNSGTQFFVTPDYDPDIDLPGPVADNESEYRISTIPEDQTDGVVRGEGLLITVDNLVGGNDMIVGNGGADQIFGGAGADTIDAGTGDDIVFGDGGRIDRIRDPLAAETPGFSDVVSSLVTRVRSIAFNDGGSDIISGAEDADILIGGQAGDDISGNDGTDIIIGDNGEIIFDVLQTMDVEPVSFSAVSTIQTTDILETTGGADNITGDAGDDIILGGVNGSMDTISGGMDDDILIGDNGILDYMLDGDFSTLDLILSLDDGLGGGDLVSGNAGNDIIIGGTGADILHGDDATGSAGAADGADIIVGDNARIEFDNGIVARVITNDDDSLTGGNDFIEGNAANDVLLGGFGADEMHGDAVAPGTFDGDDVLIGDNGEVLWNEASGASIDGAGDDDQSTIDVVRSLTDIVGDVDRLFGNSGNDLMIGGGAGDFMVGDNHESAPGSGDADDQADAFGHDVLIGDQGEITLMVAAVAPVLGQAFLASTVTRAYSKEAGIDGGSDTIEGNEGRDVIIGGDDGDLLTGETFSSGRLGDTDVDDVILGDHGLVRFDVTPADGEAGAGDDNPDTLDLVLSQDQMIGGDDTMSGGDGNDLLIGGTGLDLIIGDNGAIGTSNAPGHDVAIGDNGRITLWADGTLDASNSFRGSLVTRVATTDEGDAAAYGGADTIEGNDLADILLGGLGGDEIHGEAASSADVTTDDTPVLHGIGEPTDHGDVIIGDQGEVRFDVFDIGSLDEVELNDILAAFFNVVGGFDLDRLIGAEMTQLDRSTLDLVITGADLTEGGNDTIYANNDDDIVFGGVFDDMIFGDVFKDEGASTDYGEDILVGDGGLLTLRDGAKTFLTTRHPDDGGVDTIAGNEADDIILGGYEADFLFGEAADAAGLAAMAAGAAGDDIILGDNGRLDWVLDEDEIMYRADVEEHLAGIVAILDGATEDSSTLDRIMTTSPLLGGNDVIYGNGNSSWVDFVGGISADADSDGDVDSGDVIFGGTGSDLIVGDSVLLNTDMLGLQLDGPDGADLIFGDNGKLYPNIVAQTEASVGDGDFFLGNDFFSIDIFDMDVTADQAQDIVFGNGGDDIIIGGQDDDVLFGGADDDDIIGGHNVAGGDDELHPMSLADQYAIDPFINPLVDPSMAAEKELALAFLNPADFADLNDVIDGGGDDDVIAGDNAIIIRQPTLLANEFNLTLTQSPRFRTAIGGLAYQLTYDLIGDGTGPIAETTVGFEANVLSDLENEEAHLDMALVRRVTLLDHTGTIAQTAADNPSDPRPFGNDVIAGGHNDDEIWGQLGDDIIQGDGSIDIITQRAHMLFDTSQGASPNFDIRDIDLNPHDGIDTTMDGDDWTLEFNVVENILDGDDYIEGNGGNDRIFGGLGQDDLIGGSSDLFGTAASRITTMTQGGPGPVNEVQQLQVSVFPGTFQLHYDGVTSTTVINTDPSTIAAELAAALDEILGAGNYSLSAPLAGDNHAYDITFIGTYAGYNAQPIRVIDDFRPDGADMIFGGAGDHVDRNDIVDPVTGFGAIFGGESHGRDADVILGDNGQIFRLVTADGTAYERFRYDENASSGEGDIENGYELAIIPRVVNLLDYFYWYQFETGDARDSLHFSAVGAGDLIFGETGDDVVHGMTGDDVVFGNDGDDDLFGEAGNDWISGGAGRDGILGDDGLIKTSRNEEKANPNDSDPAEALYGIAKLDEVNVVISTPGNIQQETIDIENQLQKDVELIAFRTDDLDPTDGGVYDMMGGVFMEPLRFNDIIFGGLGGGNYVEALGPDNFNGTGLAGDFIHGGDGDDGISGAEALPAYYSGFGFGFDNLNNFLRDLQNAATEVDPDLADKPFWFDFAPYNPGDLLRFEGNGKPAEFALYDEFFPRREIVFDFDAYLNGGSVEALSALAGVPEMDQLGFILNFDADDIGAASDDRWTDDAKLSDGDDKIFGDLGNDWIVGGTGRDHTFGGRGSDLLNMDDDHTSGTGGTHPNAPPGDPIDNTQSDEFQAYADIGYGGAGRDVLILNTGAATGRSIGWVNSTRLSCRSHRLARSIFHGRFNRRYPNICMHCQKATAPTSLRICRLRALRSTSGRFPMPSSMLTINLPMFVPTIPIRIATLNRLANLVW